MILVKTGDRGRKVVDIQAKLSRLGFSLGRTGIDGIFGPETERAVRTFQQKRNLEVDGVVGPETWHELVEASYRLGDRQLYFREPPFRGDDVREIQATLNDLGFNAGRVSGVFGSQTDKAVREFQKNVGLPVDGIFGETSIRAMDNLQKRVKSGGITSVWERGLEPQIQEPSLASELQDRRLAVDFSEGKFAEDIARRLGRLFEERGAQVFYLHQAGVTEVGEKARMANAKEVDLLISLDLGRADDERKRGTQCLYFATGDYFSARSKQLAQLIQEGLTSLLPLPDNGTEGKNLPILKGTKMPAVVVKPVHVSNPEDSLLIQDESFRQKIAQAILSAVRRYWL